MNKGAFVSLSLIFAIAVTGCARKTPYEKDADAHGYTAPTTFTAELNAEVRERLDFSDQQDFADCRRGLIAADPELRVKNAAGESIWDLPAYDFIDGEPPASVNPSLWRQAKLNNIAGLFKVAEGIYQLRGFCLSNMTIIEGRSGWIIVDPLTSVETATRALAFARQHLAEKPIKAVIFTHSHIDHFGGVQGVLSPKMAAEKGIRIIAPKGFMEAATSENIIAGIAMARRSEYQFGRNLPVSPRSHLDTGLGKTVPYGTMGLMTPTEIIDHTPQKKEIDGVSFVFQYAPESEAPAELTFYLPHLKAFCGAEVVSRNMHNLYTLRGSKVRDAVKWSGYIDEAISRFGAADIYFGSHHWPIWGNERIIDFLKKQRDLYKYIHDQTIRLANAGYTSLEIADMIQLPESLNTFFSNRGYYGTLRHNSRAVYQAYFGYYDGNPAHLNPLPPEDAAVRYVAYMGGGDRLMENARASFDDGEYRWVAEVLNHLVFAEPAREDARALLARTYDQLGYQAESGVWRNAYLTAASELRHGAPGKGINLSNALELLRQTPVSRFFDSMSVRLDGPAASGRYYIVNVIFTDIGESHVLTLENAVLHHRPAAPDPTANATLKLTHDLFLEMAIGRAGVKDTIFSDDLEISGSRIDLVRFFLLFDKPKGDFNIVTP